MKSARTFDGQGWQTRQTWEGPPNFQPLRLVGRTWRSAKPAAPLRVLWDGEELTAAP